VHSGIIGKYISCVRLRNADAIVTTTDNKRYKVENIRTAWAASTRAVMLKVPKYKWVDESGSSILLEPPVLVKDVYVVLLGIHKHLGEFESELAVLNVETDKGTIQVLFENVGLNWMTLGFDIRINKL